MRPLSREALSSHIQFLKSTIMNLEYRLVVQEQELEDLYHRLDDAEEALEHAPIESN